MPILIPSQSLFDGDVQNCCKAFACALPDCSQCLQISLCPASSSFNPTIFLVDNAVVADAVFLAFSNMTLIVGAMPERIHVFPRRYAIIDLAGADFSLHLAHFKSLPSLPTSILIIKNKLVIISVANQPFICLQNTVVLH
jgi:hypothetical protein